MKFIIAAALIATFAVAHAQQAPTRDAVRTPTIGTASISGIVVDDQERPQPVRRAIVTLAGDGLIPSRGAITDDEGRFEIRELPAGDFGLIVTRATYITSMYGAKRAGRPGTPVTVAAGARIGPLTVRLWRSAVISGVVRDLQGRPAANVTIDALPAKPASRTLLSLTNNGVTTNAKGEYRIFGLEPGAYVISATPPISQSPLVTLRDAEVEAIFEAVRRRAEPKPPEMPPPMSPVGYSPIFYPGTPSIAQAAALTLAAGQEAGGIDMTLALVRSGIVSGTVTRADGLPVSAGASVQLIEIGARTGPNGTTVRNGTVAANGTFRITGVAPGNYRIVARALASAPPPSPISGGIVNPLQGSATALWAESAIAVADADLTGVNLVVGPGMTITGQVIFESATLKPPTGALRVFLAPSSTRQMGTAPTPINEIAFTAPATVNPDGTFTLTSVPPGQFRLTVTGPAVDKSPWTLLSAMMGDRDWLDSDPELSGSGSATLTVTFTDQRSGIEGTFRSAGGQPVSDVFVIAFPADTKLRTPFSRRVKAVRPSVSGAFALSDLPPGDYLLAAVMDVDDGDWDVAGFLDQLVPGAAKVSVVKGQTARQDLQIAK